MGGDGEGLHAPLILVSGVVQLCEDDGQGHPAVRADVADGHIQLHDPSQGFQIGVPQVHHHSVLTAVQLQVYGNGTWLRSYGGAAGNVHRRGREGDGVALGIGVSDGLVDRLQAAGEAGVAGGEGERGPLVSGDAKLVDGPAQRAGSCRGNG